MPNFLSFLSIAARGPLAMLGYIAVVSAWVIVALHTKKATILSRSIKALPEKDRLDALALEYKTSPRDGLSAEQWIRSRVHLYVFSGFAVTCFLVLALAASAAWLKSSRASGIDQTNSVTVDRTTINQPGVVGNVTTQNPTPGHGTEGTQSPQQNTVSLTRSTINQPGVVGNVVGNVYVTYTEAKTEASSSTLSSADLRFVTDDVKIASEQNILTVRFSVFNNTSSRMLVYDVHAVEYTRGHFERSFAPQRAGAAPRRYELEIDAKHPFIEKDQTIYLESRSSRSFRLDLGMEPGVNRTEIVFGVVLYYHDAAGGSGTLKSDKLYFALPAAQAVSAYDENSIQTAFQAIQSATPSSCQLEPDGNFTNCTHEPLYTKIGDLENSLDLHRRL